MAEPSQTGTGSKSAVNAVVSFLVTEKATRPAGKDGECFYCQRKIGEPHKPDCVLINKKVKLRMTVEYDVDVPAYWDKKQIESHRNDGSWCANNALVELEELFCTDGDGPCLCSVAEFEYLGDEGEPFLDE